MKVEVIDHGVSQIIDVEADEHGVPDYPPNPPPGHQWTAQGKGDWRMYYRFVATPEPDTFPACCS